MDTLTSETPTKTPNWAHIPKDILHRILRYLDFTTDIPRLRGVCPLWRSYLPLPEAVRLTPISSFNASCIKVPNFDNSPLLLLESRFYFLSPLNPSSHPSPLHGKWLARVVPTPDDPTRFHLCNPLNFQNYILPCSPLVGKFNLLDCRATELARPMCLVGGPTGRGFDGDKPQPISKKVVGGFDLESDYLFAVMAQLGQYDKDGGLILLRVGDEEWAQIPGTFDENGLRIRDIAFYEGMFYTFSLTKFQVGVIDPDDVNLSMVFVGGPVARGEDVDGVFTFVVDGVNYILGDVHFVVSNGSLYFVVEGRKVKSKSKRGFVIVYVMRQGMGEDGKCEWERVRILNEVFFIGFDVSFSLPMANENLPEWKAGSICFFTRPFPIFFDGVWKDGPGSGMPEGTECMEMINYAEYWRYLRLYEMEGGEPEEAKKRIVPFEKLSKELYTGLFFPPPAWVQWSCPSKGNAVVKLDGLKFRDVGDMMKDMGINDASSDEEEKKENDGV